MTSQSTPAAKDTRLDGTGERRPYRAGLEALSYRAGLDALSYRASLDALPYRGTFGAERPAGLAPLPLPAAAMPARLGTRPLKAWRYVGVFSPELMACLAHVRLGPVRQSFWAVWDRGAGRLYERTRGGHGGVELGAGRGRVRDGEVALEVEFVERPGVETVCRSGALYAWTRKQAGAPARLRLALAGEIHELAARVVVDDSAGYHERHTRWWWSAGVGRTREGRDVAWNLVAGINDPPQHSERTVWVDGVPHEPPPVSFAPDLSAVGELRFRAEATRERNDNRLLVRSRYRQPFGTFSGALPGGIELADGLGVMEAHDVRW